MLFFVQTIIVWPTCLIFVINVYKCVKFEQKCGKLKMPVVEGELHRGQHTSHSKVAWTSGVPCFSGLVSFTELPVHIYNWETWENDT